MPLHGGLSTQVLQTQELGPASASSGTKNGTGVDMQGWDGVLFTINVGAITGSGVIDGYVSADVNANFATEANITGAALTQVVNANTIQQIDVYRPTKRYVRCHLVPATNTVLYSVSATRYRRNGILPFSQSAEQTVFVSQN